MKTTIRPVNEKNTKQEILSAYQELAEKLNDVPVSDDMLQKLTKTNTAFETSLHTTAIELKRNLDDALNTIIEQLTNATKAIELLRQMRDTQEKTLEQEKAQILKDHARLTEEQTYEFSKSKKRQEEELKEMRTKAEMEIMERKNALKAQEDELIDLRNQVKTFDARLAKATTDAVSAAIKDLKLQFEHEKALFTQKAQGTQELLEQQVTSLQETITTQKQEIIRLTSVAAEASTQMTRIAERAVTKTVPDISSLSPKSTPV